MQENIISTLALYEAERGLPLSAFEIFKFLHKKEKYNFVSFSDVLSSIEDLKRKNIIVEKNGFYFFEGKYDKNTKRIIKYKISIFKWKKAKKAVKKLRFIPFLESVAVSGSLSMNNTEKGSDIDFFLITKEKRIWTVRTFSVFLFHFFGKRRYKKKIKDRACLNYYVCENAQIKVKNIASANIFLRMVPVYRNDKFLLFFQKNLNWVKDYFYFFEPNILRKRQIKSNSFYSFLKLVLELVLKGKAGDFLERALSSWQKRRIQKKIKGKKISHLVFEDDLLMFHWPRPRNDEVLYLYSKNLKEKLKLLS